MKGELLHRRLALPEPWSPWRHLREYHPRVHVHEVELPPGLLGCVDHAAGVIWLDSRLNQAEKRCTLAHELGHLERGPGLCDPGHDDAEERVIDAWAARLLIPIRDLAKAFQWSAHLPEIAEELWVDEHMLRARLRGLTDTEQDQVMAAIGRARIAA